MSDHRLAAQAHVSSLVELLNRQLEGESRAALVAECEALALAIRAFHMEGIRFRMFNVDRLMARAAPPLPDDAITAFAEARHHLEAAGFHTRSHQAPT
jgi:hypothetical protein